MKRQKDHSNTTCFVCTSFFLKLQFQTSTSDSISMA